MIPEEDRGPAWLRNYRHTDFGDIEADIAAMEQFARKLADDVQNNYRPHMRSVSSSMLTELPSPSADFGELVSFLQAHRDAQSVTQSNVYNFADGTDTFAAAAQTISREYAGTDAFSRARVRDVQAAFENPDPLIRPEPAVPSPSAAPGPSAQPDPSAVPYPSAVPDPSVLPDPSAVPGPSAGSSGPSRGVA